jgi:uncharacterized protein (TIGR02145 family)
MKRALLFSLILFLFTALLCGPAKLIASDKPGNLVNRQDARPGFIENKGQIIDQKNNPNPAVLYLLNTPGMNVQLRKGGFSYDLYQVRHGPQANCRLLTADCRLGGPSRHDSAINYHRIDIDLVNANPDPAIKTSAPSSDYLNFYTKGTPVDGVTSVRSYTTVTYKDIYPGIDLQFNADNDRLFEYNFILQPGADINAIKLKVYGPEKIKSYYEGLRCETSLGDVDETIPVCYYSIDNSRVPVKGSFKKIAEHLYGFSVNLAIPSGAFLVIDPIPTRRWGTYFGGLEGESTFGHGCITDESGNILIAGETQSTGNIATAGAFQTTLSGSEDAYLAKFSSSGQQLWGTYFGGNSTTDGYSCTLDPSGNIYLCGTTKSTTGLTTPGAFQTTLHGTMDAFLAKFDSSGFRIWCTYYGGYETGTQPFEEFSTCCCDTNGNVICSGRTYSPDYISTPGSSQPVYGGNGDAFLVKFTGSGQRLWGTYYGGSGQEGNAMCSISNNGTIFITGVTVSANNISTPGCFQPTLGGNSDAFLASFSPDGVRLWGTYFGGDGDDIGYDCIVDTDDNIYFVGLTGSSTQIATPGAFQETLPFPYANAGFLEKFTSAGTRLWGTYYGSFNDLEGLAIDDSGYVFVSGRCFGFDPHNFSPGAYQTVFRGGSDALLAKFDGNGQRIWGTYYGGTSFEYGTACAVDHDDNVYLYGFTSSENNGSSQTSLCTRDPLANFIATPGSHQSEKSVGPWSDAFLVKFADCYSPDTAAQIFGPASLCQSTTGIVYSIDPIPSASSLQWCVSGNLTITGGQGTTAITINVGPAFGRDTISVYGINACDTGFPKVIIRRVYPRPIPLIAGADTTCAGVINLFTTAGGKTNYQWTVSPGGTITSGGTVTDSACSVSWNTGGAMWIRVGYTDTTGCISQNPIQFNVWVNPGLLTSVSITSSSNPVCAGSSVNYTAIPTNGGANPAYQWKVNGINGGTNNPTYSYLPVNGDTVTCQLTSSLTGCLSGNPAISNTIVMVVNPNLPVSVSVAPSQNPVCAGTSVTFTATPTNGGLSPSYQWKVNGINVGTNSSTYSYIPANGDLVSCILTSSETCTTGNPASSIQYPVSVNPNLPVSVTIAPSQNPVCTGNSITFTATPTNGGLSPSYQWKVNGISVGTNSPLYSYVPTNGDLVSCILTSSETCTTGNPASSIQYPVSVSPNLPTGITIAASSNPFCPGSPVTFTATPVNGGSTPAYQWKVNGINAGTNSHTFTYNPVNNDSVRCVMTSDLGCVTGNPASSIEIIMSGTLAPIVTFTACFDTITSINAKPIRLKGGIPLGGTYSGPGVNSVTGIFNPATAGVGTKTITYTYTNAANCSALAHAHIINYPLSIINCGSPITDIRDNKVYQTVQIGSQCWMAEDLNYGTEIPVTQDQRDNCIPEKYSLHPSPLTTHSFYQWDEVMQYDNTPADQGFCPPAWHVPTENDWNTLFATYINNGFAGSPLKYSGYSGFNALLSGVRNINKSWDFQGFATFFWSSTLRSSTQAWAHGMNDPDPSVSIYPASRANAFSVRCIHD